MGLDPLPRAIELAATVARDGLADRIELRCQGVQAFEDDQVFDLAWLPLPFISRGAVREGLPRVLHALRPGGWLLLPGSTFEPGASGGVARWQVHLTGAPCSARASGGIVAGGGLRVTHPAQHPAGGTTDPGWPPPAKRTAPESAKADRTPAHTERPISTGFARARHVNRTVQIRGSLRGC